MIRDVFASGITMRKTMFIALLVASVAATTLCAMQPETVSGAARVVDGDSVDIGTVHIRLFGIDAPEGRQLCTRDSNPWPCGAAAAEKLRDLIGGATIDCVQRDVDKYERMVAVCKKGPTDLGAAMVKAGLALSYRQYSIDYVDEEDDARRAKRGMWAGEFIRPWDYRHSTPGSPESGQPTPPQTPSAQQQPQTERPTKCRIKGNINSHGERIYHLPGTPGYDSVVIDPNKGERWLCTEEEAKAAGWRAPRG
jgi:endonuclease YncB( thermonuclease family)